MFDNIRSAADAVDRFHNIQDVQDFEHKLYLLQEYMKRINIPSKNLIELEKRAYYLQNEYSEKDTRERVKEAGLRVADFIEEIINGEQEKTELSRILNNFYIFIETLTERPPYGRGTLTAEQLSCLKIQNEYDVQHFLYAYLRPLYPMARLEVSEDAGYGTVRPDIYIDAEHVIEIKCTRTSMKQKKLTEEIEADIVHYAAKNIYFFIYDKEKIIENPQAFKANYEKIIKEKNIHIIIHQPKIL